MLPGAGCPIPPEVEPTLRAFRTAEFATIGKDGVPIAWPTSPLYLPERGQFLLTTSVGLPQKAFNVRRNPRVSLLYSNPTASGLASPPAVLVQGDATVSKDIITWNDDLEEFWLMLATRQPASAMFSSNPLSRRFFAWYYWRLTIVVTPRRIRWWPEGDVARAARELEVAHVG